MKKPSLREIRDTVEASGRSECLAQSFDLSYIISQTYWEVQCGDKFN